MTAHPNLYDFATSELSQDATLAYILSWAHPEHRATNEGMHALGRTLLRAFLKAAGSCTGRSDPLNGGPIESVNVETQQDRVDVRVVINGSLVLLIEDKTGSAEHSDQITKAEKRELARGTPRDAILSAYCKTGNESLLSIQAKKHCGVLLRRDLLAVLNAHPDTGNTIFEEFRAHLQRIEDRTESFRTTSWKEWSWSARQGFLLALQQWFFDKSGHRPDWGYSSNARGGMLVFYWAGYRPEGLPYEAYLQIQDAAGPRSLGLFLRGSCRKPDKMDSHKLYHLLGVAKEVATEPRFETISVRKAGSYQGGRTAAAAMLTFGAGHETFLAVRPDRLLDFEATAQRLSLAGDFVAAVARRGAEKGNA